MASKIVPAATASSVSSPDESSSSSSSSSFRFSPALLGVGAAAAAAFVALGYHYFMKKSRQSEKTRKKSRKSKGEAVKTEAEAPALSAESVQKLFAEAIDSLNKGQLPETLEAAVRGQIPRIVDPQNNFPPELRIMAAQFLLGSVTLKVSQFSPEDSSGSSEAQLENLLAAQSRDTRVAWRLVQVPMNRPEDARAVDLIQLQIAQNLKDSQLMAPIFDRMTARVDGELSRLAEDEKLVLFTVAPLLGRWKQTRRLGELLIKQAGSLDDFHNAPMDYQMLWKLAKKQAKDGDAEPHTLRWVQYEIVAQRIKLKEIECDDTTTIQQLKAEFQSADPEAPEPEWKPVQTQAHSRIIRCGGICQVQSFSSVPIQLVGPCSYQIISCKGYADLETPHGIVRQTESYVLRNRTNQEELEEIVPADSTPDLLTGSALPNPLTSYKRVVPGQETRWTGTFAMTQENIRPSSAANLNLPPKTHIIFELEVTLRTLPA